jgi:hypothetical protein
MLVPLALVYSLLRARLDQVRADDRGMTTEAMIITAILAAVALAVVGAIAVSIRDKGSEIEDDIDAALGLL